MSRLIYVRAIHSLQATHGVMADSRSRNIRSQNLLQRVADALGLPAEAFYSDAIGEVGDLLMLMRLWSSIEDKQARQRILMVAKQEFERSGGGRTS